MCQPPLPCARRAAGCNLPGHVVITATTGCFCRPHRRHFLHTERRSHGIEPFNEDVEAKGWPPNVQKLRHRLEPADAIIFASPEYNYSIPGALKNAIDWLSRPEREGPIFGKPAAIIGASPSMIGTARVQAHLRDVVFYNGMPLLPAVEILIARAGEKFDDDGNLEDDKTRKFLTELTERFTEWVEHRLSG